MALHVLEQPLVAIFGVVPVAAIVPVFTGGAYRHCRGTTAEPARLFSHCVGSCCRELLAGSCRLSWFVCWGTLELYFVERVRVLIAMDGEEGSLAPKLFLLWALFYVFMGCERLGLEVMLVHTGGVGRSFDREGRARVGALFLFCFVLFVCLSVFFYGLHCLLCALFSWKMMGWGCICLTTFRRIESTCEVSTDSRKGTRLL